MIPIRMNQLNEAHPTLDQSSRQNAIRSVTTWPARIRPVKLKNFVGFVAQVSELGNTTLHSIGHLILTNTSSDLRVVRLHELHLI